MCVFVNNAIFLQADYLVMLIYTAAANWIVISTVNGLLWMKVLVLKTERETETGRIYLSYP